VFIGIIAAQREGICKRLGCISAKITTFDRIWRLRDCSRIGQNTADLGNTPDLPTI
jgi:hypothetical protein